MVQIASCDAQISPGLFIKVEAKNLCDFAKLFPRDNGFFRSAAFIHHNFPLNFDHAFTLSFLCKTASKNTGWDFLLLCLMPFRGFMEEPELTGSGKRRNL